MEEIGQLLLLLLDYLDLDEEFDLGFDANIDGDLNKHGEDKCDPNTLSWIDIVSNRVTVIDLQYGDSLET